MKIIPTMELNEDLANIKQSEHKIITQKISAVVKVLITSLVVLISCYSMWEFLVESLFTIPDNTPLIDKVIHVSYCLIKNLLVSASVCLIITGVFKSINFIVKNFLK